MGTGIQMHTPCTHRHTNIHTHTEISVHDPLNHFLMGQLSSDLCMCERQLPMPGNKI